MKIYYSPYSLRKKNKVNAQDTAATREGVLIKVEEGEHWGVADLAPWPELGDLKWQDELKTEGLLFQRALFLAQVDLDARRAEVSLLKDQPVTNNYLVTDFSLHNPKDPSWIGQTIKIKGTTDISGLAQFIHALPNDLKIRIDFNNCLNPDLFESFLGKVFLAVDKIEYIEDPTPYEIESWSGWNQMIPLAWDFQNETPAEFSYSHRIVKPTRIEIPAKIDYTLTSDMGHPVGLAHGLRLAQNFALNASGFLTLDLFETTNFNSYFVQSGVQLNFAKKALQETGIGMTEELTRLSWQPWLKE